jgi:hypothetical protein
MTTSLNPDAQLRPQDPDGPGGGGSPIEDHALECLTETRLNSFTATPASIAPFGGPVTLKWSVSKPSGCGVAVRLNGQTVPLSGSREVAPSVTTHYGLVASIGGLSTSLGGVTVNVDTSACVTVPQPESQIRDVVRATADELAAASDKISQRSPASVDVDTNGVSVGIRLAIAINNFADPDLDIDCRIGLEVRDGRARAFYHSFSVDLDWPWWVTAVTIGVTKVIEELIEEFIDGFLKPEVLSRMQARVDAMVDDLPDGFTLHSLRFTPDAVMVTACPSGGGRTRPFVVPAIRIDPGVVFSG